MGKVTKRPIGTDVIGPALAAARRRAGLNQKALAARIGADQSYVSKVERNAVDPQTSTLIQLARALELELMLVPRQLVPAVQALQREIAPDPRNAPSKIDQDLLRLTRNARGLALRYPTLPALAEVATAADELRIARLDESAAAQVRPLIDSAAAIIRDLLGSARAGPSLARSKMTADAALGPIARDLNNQLNLWIHREGPSTSLPAYRLGDDNA